MKLSPQSLQKILAAMPQGPLQKAEAQRLGAVMAIFLEAGGEPSLIFTKRAATLGEHAGQISFPGGAVEEGDACFQAAALRETAEEIFISRNELEILAPLPPQPVLNTWLIHPFAAWWPAPRPLAKNEAEVASIIIHPISDLLRQHQAQSWRIPGPDACKYDLGGEILWGATARIVGRMLDYL